MGQKSFTSIALGFFGIWANNKEKVLKNWRTFSSSQIGLLITKKKVLRNL